LLPSAIITNTSGNGPFRPLAKAIFVPSGDQLGDRGSTIRAVPEEVDNDLRFTDSSDSPWKSRGMEPTGLEPRTSDPPLASAWIES
jgi:hypothetical protein